MSDENKNLEQIDAEVVEEGARAVTMDDIPKSASEAKTENAYSGSADASGSENAESAGTVYEEKVYSNKNSKTFAIIALILGILSIICCCTCWGGLICGVGSIILGVVSLKNEPEAKTMAIIAIVCGSFGTAFGLTGLLCAKLVDGATDLFNGSEFSDEFLDRLEDFGNL